MGTQNRPEGKARTFGENIESDLASHFCAWWKWPRSIPRAPWARAIASSRTRCHRGHADAPWIRFRCDGTIVIGEGERDEAPMLYIGEKVGGIFPTDGEVPEVDIAVDPLEGTNLCATGAPGSITVLAASERGGLLTLPTATWRKSSSDRRARTRWSWTLPCADNLKNIAQRLDRDIEDLVVIVLDRPRHEKLIADIRAAGARIRLIGDGDLSAGIAAAVHWHGRGTR